MLVQCAHCQQTVEIHYDPQGNRICPACYTINPSSILPPGTLIAGFQIHELIGKGGMGVVYKANQLNLDRLVALKILADHLAADKEFVSNFFREARAAASLSHPNIVQAFDAGVTEEGIYYFAMELLEGETLESKIMKEGTLPEKQVRIIGGQIAQALNYAWERQKLSHGDIKPENIIMDLMGDAKLADLGLAKSSYDKSNSSDVMATPLYAPPEIVSGAVSEVNIKSDMYSFGATLYHLLSGHPPFPDTDPYRAANRHITDIHIPLTQLNNISSQLSNLVDSLLQKNPEARPASWDLIVKALEKNTSDHKKVLHKYSGSSHSNINSSTEPKKMVISKTQMVYGGMALIGGILILAGGYEAYQYLLNQGDQPPVVETIDPLLNEWKGLQQSIAQKKIDERIQLVREFKNRLPEGHQLLTKVDDEIEILLRKEREIADKLAQIKREQEQLNDSVTSALQKISAVSLETKSDAELNQFITELTALLKLGSLKKEVFIVPESVNEINQSIRSIHSMLAQREKEKRIAAERIEREQMLANNLQNRLKNIEKRKTLLSRIKANEGIDQYYLLLAQMTQSFPMPSQTKDRIKIWNDYLSSGLPIPSDIESKVKLMIQILSNAKSTQGLLSKLSNNIKNQVVTSPPFPDSVHRWKIESISDANIKFTTAVSGGNIYKNIPWLMISQKATDELYKLILANNPPEKMSEQDQFSLLYYLLSTNQSAAFNLVSDTFQRCANSDIIKNLCNDLSVSKEEAVFSKYMQEVHQALAKDQWSKVAQGLAKIKILNNFPPVFSKNYLTLIDSCFEMLQSFSPESNAIYLTLMKDSSPSLLTSLQACSLAALRGGDDKIVEFAQQRLQHVLNERNQRKPISNMDATMVPFYYGEYEIPAEPFRFFFLNPMPVSNIKTVASFTILLDGGRWRSIKTQLSSLQKELMDLVKETKLKNNSLPAIFFATHCAASHFQNDDLLRYASEHLVKLAQNAQDLMMPLSMGLASDALIRERRFESAYQLSSNYKKSTYLNLDFRVHLCSLLASVYLSDKKHFLKNYEHLKLTYPHLNDDLQWCALAKDILIEGKSISLNDISRLTVLSPSSPDLCARVLISTLSRSLYETKDVQNGLPEFLKMINQKISGNFYSSELWHDWACLKIAVSIDHGNFSETLCELLNDPRLAALSDYPGLAMAHYAALVHTQQMTVQEAQEVLKNIIATSPVWPDALKDAYLQIGSSNVMDLPVLVSISSKKAAFPLLIPIFICNSKGSSYRESANKLINEIKPMLSWTELYLSQKLNDY